MGKVSATPKYLAIALVRCYRYFISPFLAPSCRFAPSCSEYAIDSLRKHGFVKGMLLTIRRILKCHPFHAGGYDPVPDELNVTNKVKVNDS